MTHPSRHRRSKARSLYVWHRWLGISAALLAMILAITGIALNHTEQLKLDQRPVRSEALLAWYGIESPKQLISYSMAANRLTQAGDHWYLNAEALTGEFAPLRGALSLAGTLVAVGPDSVWLLTPQGQVVERMGRGAGVPAAIRRIGTDSEGRVLIDSEQGFFRSDRNLVQWQPVATPGQVRWAAPEPLPTELRDRILQRYRGAGLSMERVLLDLHSGRLFGAGGVYVMDAAAVILLLLAASGVWLWARAVLRRRRR